MLSITIENYPFKGWYLTWYVQSRLIDPKELVKKNPVLQNIDLNLCVDCKAVKQLCGLSRCPLIDALDVYPDPDEYSQLKSNSIFGPTPQIFVGSHGYPRVNSGPLTSVLENPELAPKAANPSEWVDLGLKEIISLRYGMVRGKKNMYVKPYANKEDRLYDQLGQLTMSIKPVDIESLYTGIPRMSATFDIETQPMGPAGNLARIDIASNPKIPKKVDYVLGDELKSNQQVKILYEDNHDVYYLQNILSAGLTGLQESKKMVPTRWSITATDDMIGKNLIPNQRDYASVNHIEVRNGQLLGNEYTIIFLPGTWSFENFETWISGGIFTLGSSQWQSSYCHEGFNVKEYYKGRNSYASQAGGYYATRLAVLEHLEQRKRQAKVIVIREITPDYVVPVGVWQVREGVRKSLKSDGVLLETKEELKQYLRGRFHIPIDNYTKQSLTFIQSSLDDFF